MQYADVLKFWLEEVAPKRWYLSDAALDAEIRARFEGVWRQALAGELDDWTATPEGVLAFILLTDQFPRNMFRGTAQAFATDDLALKAAKCAIDRGFDRRIDEPARQFFYLPLMHSESLMDQERCVRLVLTRLTRNGSGNLLHARVHREVIRRFGRFPYRNAALARETTGPEAAFVASGGYGAVLHELQGAPAA